MQELVKIFFNGYVKGFPVPGTPPDDHIGLSGGPTEFLVDWGHRTTSISNPGCLGLKCDMSGCYCKLTLSGIHISFVVGYGWSKRLRKANSDVSSSRDTICTCQRNNYRLFHPWMHVHTNLKAIYGWVNGN